MRNRCGLCERRCPKYDLGEGRRRWRSLDAGSIRVFLEADAPRMSCLVHGVIVAAVPWTRHQVSHTGFFDAQERRVPLDVDLAEVIQTYLLVEPPETDSARLFIVAKDPNRGNPLTPADLRTIFRYLRMTTGVIAGHPHALRHTFDPY